MPIRPIIINHRCKIIRNPSFTNIEPFESYSTIVINTGYNSQFCNSIYQIELIPVTTEVVQWYLYVYFGEVRVHFLLLIWPLRVNSISGGDHLTMFSRVSTAFSSKETETIWCHVTHEGWNIVYWNQCRNNVVYLHECHQIGGENMMIKPTRTF